MRHQYECGKCGLRSTRHLTRNAAEQSGQTHRDEAHGGMHPVEESILTHGGGYVPTLADWKPFAILAALLLVGLVNKFL